MIKITQGDLAILEFTAVDGNENPIDITGATFTTLINAANGAGVNSFPDVQHTIVDGPEGRFNLTLQVADTQNCGQGLHKEIITQIVRGSTPIWYRGKNVLTVYPPTPFQ